MTKRIVVLGLGRIGGAIAQLLNGDKRYRVIGADINSQPVKFYANQFKNTEVVDAEHYISVVRDKLVMSGNNDQLKIRGDNLRGINNGLTNEINTLKDQIKSIETHERDDVYFVDSVKEEINRTSLQAVKNSDLKITIGNVSKDHSVALNTINKIMESYLSCYSYGSYKSICSEINKNKESTKVVKVALYLNLNKQENETLSKLISNNIIMDTPIFYYKLMSDKILNETVEIEFTFNEPAVE